ncbi:hypothetical protein HYC85_020019 [Camellia sinensis]|uniref:Protein kinase domain-containing protein n=1 Tax=Camellia sinensis TaxID=4442 RepID=A0A7J7GPG7_CAMSI|nr:hypothetical protein HYC85_020019 [Camellia sinensis]
MSSKKWRSHSASSPALSKAMNSYFIVDHTVHHKLYQDEYNSLASFHKGASGPVITSLKLLGSFSNRWVHLKNTTQAIPGAQDNPPMKTKKKLYVDILIIGISLSALGFMVLAISGVLLYKNHVFLAYKKIPNEKGNLELGEDVPFRTFTLVELEHVTNGFKGELGRGAFGTVFKGIIPYNSKDVAVTRLDKVLTKGEREFQTEIKVIGRTHHRYLVHLIGYCLDFWSMST